jgi:hypothetical protein
MSRQRIRSHVDGKAGVASETYRIPLVVENVQRAAEGAYENIGGRQEQEYLSSESEESSETEAPLLPKPNHHHEKHSAKLNGAAEADNSVSKHKSDFPTLALTQSQFDMIDALDEVGFQKYRVHIHKDRHTHAAIIVRMDTDRFSEGKLVVQHWISNFEV